MDYIAVALFAILGAVIGSFLNVCIDRLPVGQSLRRPPSHCPACQRRLGFWDLIPVVSYLWLRGRCRYCSAAIPRRILIVEVGTGLLFAFLWWRYGFDLQLLFFIFFGCLFIVLFFIDLEHGLILNKVVYPAAIVTLCIAPFRPDLGTANSLIGIGIIDSLVGGGIAFGLFLLVALVSRGGMGWGDVKMAGLVGLATGFPLVLIALFISVVTGALVSVVLLFSRLKRRKDPIPFGPFLSLGAMATLFWGDAIYAWCRQILL